MILNSLMSFFYQYINFGPVILDWACYHSMWQTVQNVHCQQWDDLRGLHSSCEFICIEHNQWTWSGLETIMFYFFCTVYLQDYTVFGSNKSVHYQIRMSHILHNLMVKYYQSHDCEKYLTAFMCQNFTQFYSKTVTSLKFVKFTA